MIGLLSSLVIDENPFPTRLWEESLIVITFRFLRSLLKV